VTETATLVRRGVPSHAAGKFVHIAGSAAALPANSYAQHDMQRGLCRYIFGDDWETRPDLADQVRTIEKVFSASRVEFRQMAMDVFDYYRHGQPPTTGERMSHFDEVAYPLARTAILEALSVAGLPVSAISDLIVVSCTGYSAPGLDIKLAHGLDITPSVRKVVIGHMGCFGALVGLRAAFGVLHAYHNPTVALVATEFASLHTQASLDPGVMAASALFGDATAALIMVGDPSSRGPELIDTYCAADFDAQEQMTWNISDEGFVMGLSRRIPITLRRNVANVVDNLLAPHGLTPSDITHWLVHPGGPDILDVVANRLNLSDQQMQIAWEVLRDHGNCSSVTVLLMLNRLLQSQRAQPGELGVMMAFGPGLTLETCLLRF